ncbi:hypothetical protein Gotur_034304 [Gossypium turneri]
MVDLSFPDPTEIVRKKEIGFVLSESRLLSAEKMFGVVVRDENVMVISSKIVMCENIPSVFAVEAMTCLQAIQQGLNLGLSVVEIEEDA